MFEWSESSVVFLHGHSPYSGEDVYVNVAMIAGASVKEVTFSGKTIKVTRITTVGTDECGVYEVKESFKELIDQANGLKQEKSQLDGINPKNI